MNENLNLIEILKDAPKGTKLWSPICGECELVEIDGENTHPIICRTKSDGGDICCEAFTADGKFYCDYKNGECVLFPSKEKRDWSSFKVSKSLKDEKNYIIKPFDKVFGWNNYNPHNILYPDIFLCKVINDELHKIVYQCEFGTYDHIKPYSEEEYLERNSNSNSNG